jgi:hypothetical protein
MERMTVKTMGMKMDVVRQGGCPTQTYLSLLEILCETNQPQGWLGFRESFRDLVDGLERGDSISVS